MMNKHENTRMQGTATKSTPGTFECALAGLSEAAGAAANGILVCTINDKTHAPDVRCQWGRNSFLNDLYFGLHGGLYIADETQHTIFKNELRKIAATCGKGQPGQCILPWSVNETGAGLGYNEGGMDLDRCAEFVLMVVRTYELTGDKQFAEDLYPTCVEVMNWLRNQDPDQDGLLEGRTIAAPVTAVGSCASVSYIGDTAKNDHKDFGASMFFYDALNHLALLEEVLGKRSEAAAHRREAVELHRAINGVFWNPETAGYLAWIDRLGKRHDDWITGNNLHAIACGVADAAKANAILAKMAENRATLEDVVPCRVRLGLFEEGYCSNRADDYWNGGCWTLVSAPDMLARRQMSDVDGALYVADRLANHVTRTPNGFYEAYDGVTGEPNKCEGLLMNNGGFIWGLLAGVLGVDFHGDELLISDTVPLSILPARARVHYRSGDIVFHWEQGPEASVALDGKSVQQEAGCYRCRLTPKAGGVHEVKVRTPVTGIR